MLTSLSDVRHKYFQGSLVGAMHSSLTNICFNKKGAKATHKHQRLRGAVLVPGLGYMPRAHLCMHAQAHASHRYMLGFTAACAHRHAACKHTHTPACAHARTHMHSAHTHTNTCTHILMPGLCAVGADSTRQPELRGRCSIVRELHVYGTAVAVHARDTSKFQHQG